MNSGAISLHTRRRQETRADVIRVAFDLFGKHGYEQVSVEMIAAAAGISRATFFNYFPQKELILREIAAARLEKLKSSLARFGASGHPPTFDGIVQLMLKISEENARITRQSKKLLLETVFRQASQGPLLATREKAIDALAEFIGRIPRRRKVPARLCAETVFAIYMATMLEWLMREDVPQKWLVNTMRERLQLTLEGLA